MLMADVVVGNDQSSGGKFRFIKNLSPFTVILIIIVIATLSIVAFTLTRVQEQNDRIKIGDRTITAQDVESYAKQSMQYNDDPENQKSLSEAKSVAVDDLVTNAVLANEAKKRNVSISSQDILKEVAGNEPMNSEEGFDTSKDLTNYVKTRTENKIYKNKLSEQLIKKRDLFFVSVNIDSPYFASAKDSEVDAKLQEAKNKIAAIEPLFKQKLSKEEIAKKVDVRFFGENENSRGQATLDLFFKQPVSTANIINQYTSDENSWNDLNSGKFMRYKVDKWQNTDSQILRLKKKGDYIKINASKTGNIMLVRLENINKGKYESWQELTGKPTKELSKIVGLSSNSSKLNLLIDQKQIPKTTSLYTRLEKILFPEASAYASYCGEHNLAIRIYSWDDDTNSLIPDNSGRTAFKIDSRPSNCRKAAGTFYTNRGPLGPGRDDSILDNCYSPEPEMSVVGLANPATWTKVPGGSYGSYEHGTLKTMGIKITTHYYDSRGVQRVRDGLPQWGVDWMNNGKVDIFFHYRKKPVVNATTTAPSTVQKGQTVTFTHNIKNNSSYSVEYLWKWRRYYVKPGRLNAAQAERIINADIESPNDRDIAVREQSDVGRASPVRPGASNPNNLKEKFTIPDSYADNSYVCENIHAANLSSKYGTEVRGSDDTSYTQCVKVLPQPCTPCPGGGCAPCVSPVVSQTKPFFRAINGSVMAGCDKGVLGGYYKTSSPADPRASTTLAAYSNNGIVGFSSAFGGASPLLYSFSSTANTPVGAIGSTDSPKLGGSLNGLRCTKAQLAPSSFPAISSFSTGTYYKNGNYTIDQQSIENGQRIDLNITGDVYIKGNIKFENNNWATINDIPAFVLRVTGNIYIDENVTQLDGLYIAMPDNSSDKGAIFTCAQNNILRAPTDFNAPKCGKQLKVFGAFYANKINLLRTFTNATGAPAEEFYMSPEILINGTSIDSTSVLDSAEKYDLIQNLPPVL